MSISCSISWSKSLAGAGSRLEAAGSGPLPPDGTNYFFIGCEVSILQKVRMGIGMVFNFMSGFNFLYDQIRNRSVHLTNHKKGRFDIRFSQDL
jgi:hypothetical protein